MTFDLIIFDCDGTLVDSEYLNCVSTSEVIIDAGLPRYSVDVIYAEMVGMSLDNIYKKIEAESNITLPPDMTQRIIDRVDANAEELMKRIEGARDTVAWAADKYTMCVASNGERQNVMRSLEITTLNDFFKEDHIFTAANVKAGKPAPDLFLHAAAKTGGVALEKCVVIEDTVVGITAAKAAGMTAIGFTAAHSKIEGYADRLKAAGADHIMTHWSEFQALIT